MAKFEVYDVETLQNIYTYTGYNCITKEWKQFVICNWRNDIDELVKHLLLLKQDQYYMVGFNNENFDYPIIHHILYHQHPNNDYYLSYFERKTL